MGENTVKFAIVADMLERVSKQKKAPQKRRIFRTFLDHFYTDREYFSVMRLILPELDRERGNYGLKESVLAVCLTDALGLARGSQDAEKLAKWRRGGAEAGKHAGNFSLVAAEVVGSRQVSTPGDLTVKQVNDTLDAIAAARTRDEKSKLLGELINKTSPLEMKWIIMIILKELKLGISEKTFFKEFHPDAEDVYNKTCDLKLVCERLIDPKVRYKRQDIEVGRPVRPQLASRAANVESAWKKLRGKRVIAECKFDGDRCQVHKDGNTVHFFSRSSIDHKEFADAMKDVILGNVLANKCILDGEMLVWNRVTNRFSEFGNLQEVARAAQDEQTDEQLCYVTFDILYVEDASVIHQPLHERHKLLASTVRPLSGRLEILQPDRRNSGQLWSVSVQAPEQLEQFFKATVENRDEGVVIKDLDSKWEPGDRSGKWIKLKPDYIHPESDLDVLIIGGYYGSGRRGGEVAQFLLALADSPVNGNPTKFVSFCKVGTGLSDEECATLVDKLKPFFKRNDKNSRPPSCYIVTNHSKERPDVWIYPPDKSVILQVASDIRCIKSEVFASPYCLRFPRVHDVRYDKPWYDCLTVQGLMEIVGNQGGTTIDVAKRKVKTPKKKKVVQPLLPQHLQRTDVSSVAKVSELFSGMDICVLNDAPDWKTDKLHALIQSHGGKFSMNNGLNVTHVVAANKKGLRFQTAAKKQDVLHYSWLVDSAQQGRVLPFRPKYVLHLTDETKERFKDAIDAYGDHYFVDADKQDLEHLLEGIKLEDVSVDDEALNHCKKKLASKGMFKDHIIYLHRAGEKQDESAAAAMRRLEIDVISYGGVVQAELSENATEVVVLWGSGFEVPELSQQSSLLRNKNLQVLSHKWIEDAVERGILPRKDNYDLEYAFCEGEVKLRAPLHRDNRDVDPTSTVPLAGSSDKADILKLLGTREAGASPQKQPSLSCLLGKKMRSGQAGTAQEDNEAADASNISTNGRSVKHTANEDISESWRTGTKAVEKEPDLSMLSGRDGSCPQTMSEDASSLGNEENSPSKKKVDMRKASVNSQAQQQPELASVNQPKLSFSGLWKGKDAQASTLGLDEDAPSTQGNDEHSPKTKKVDMRALFGRKASGSSQLQQPEQDDSKISLSKGKDVTEGTSLLPNTKKIDMKALFGKKLSASSQAQQPEFSISPPAHSDDPILGLEGKDAAPSSDAPTLWRDELAVDTGLTGLSEPMKVCEYQNAASSQPSSISTGNTTIDKERLMDDFMRDLFPTTWVSGAAAASTAAISADPVMPSVSFSAEADPATEGPAKKKGKMSYKDLLDPFM